MAEDHAADHADRLYGLPLEDFVAERDALAKQLRRDGDRAAADEVKKLAKPTRAAGVVNRLTRERRSEVGRLVAFGDALAEAQEELLAGGDPAVLRDAAAAARQAVDALVASAGVDGATAEKVRATLHAATVDEDVRREVAAGRVLKDRTAAGFGGLDALVAAAAAKGGAAKRATAPGAKGAAGKRAPAKGGAPKRAPSATATKAKPRGPSERELRRRRDALRRASEAEAAAEADVAGARRALEQVESTLRARRADLERAEQALSEARARRERAEAEAR